MVITIIILFGGFWWYPWSSYCMAVTRGVLPYIIPIRVCATGQRGRDFEADPDLERGIYFRGVF